MKEIKTFQQMYRDGHVNRREFLAAMGALGVTAATAGSFLTSSSALAATPTRGGSVIFASNLHGPDDTLDPIARHINHRLHPGKCGVQWLDPGLDRHEFTW